MVSRLQKQAASLNRTLHAGDAKVLSSAMQEGLSVLTNDRRFSNFMRAIDWPTRQFLNVNGYDQLEALFAERNVAYFDLDRDTVI